MINKFRLMFGLTNLMYGFGFLFLGIEMFVVDWTTGMFILPFGISTFGIGVGISEMINSLDKRRKAK